MGDIHFRFEDKLLKAIKQDSYDCLVFGGDTFDPWRGQSIEELIIKYHEIFKELQRLKAKVVFIRGNHDPNIDVLRKYGFEVRKNYSYIAPDKKKVRIMHGHEFDIMSQKVEFITRKLIYLEERINEFLNKVNEEYAVRIIELLGNLDLQRVIDNFYSKIKKYKNWDKLIFGHVHVPWEGHRQNLDFYNWGSWQGHYGTAPSYITHLPGKIKMVQV